MDTPALSAVLEARNRATQAVTSMRAELDSLEKWRRLLDAVAEGVEQRPAATAALLGKSQDLIRSREETEPETVADLRRVWQSCQQLARERAHDSVRTFAEAADSAALAIDPTSRHPKYTFDDHFIEVELLERDLTAVIDIRHGDRIREPLDVPVVIERVKAEHDRLFGRPWNRNAFIKQLQQAYKRKRGGSDGAELRDLANAMSKGTKKVRLDEFAVDLSRLLHDKDVGSAGVRIATNQTRDTKRGLLLPGLERGGYVLSLTMEDAP